MILVCTNNKKLVESIRSELPDCAVARAWKWKPGEAMKATLIVVDLDGLDDPQLMSRHLSDFTSDPLAPPIVGLAETPSEKTFLIVPVRFTRILRSDELHKLQLEIQAQGHEYCREVCRKVQKAEALSECLQRFLLTLFSCSHPVRTAGRLAKIIGVHRATLYRELNEAFAHDEGHKVSWKDLLDWQALLLVGCERASGRTWEEVKTRLGLSREQAHALCKRLLGITVGIWGRRNYRVTISDFEKRVLNRLLS